MNNLSRVFGSQVVIQNLNKSIPLGDFVCFLGPSGCGKSTLLRLIAGLDQPSGGRIDGVPRNRGFVFQDATLLPWRSAVGNVTLGQELNSQTWASHRAGPDPKAFQLLEQLGLKGHELKFPRELSGGMRMRVSLARALYLDPQLILMDEPFSALDETIRFRLQQDFRDLWFEKRFTAILVTHSVQEAVFLSNRVLFFSATGGHILKEWKVSGPEKRDAQFRNDPATVRLVEDIRCRMEEGP